MTRRAPWRFASSIIALATLIIVNVIAVILESVSWMSQRYSITFLAIERVATAIFVAEYFLRVWTAVDYRNGRFRNPIWGRLEYMRGFFPLIDLIAVLPAVLGFFGGADLRVLRLLRLFADDQADAAFDRLRLAVGGCYAKRHAPSPR